MENKTTTLIQEDKIISGNINYTINLSEDKLGDVSYGNTEDDSASAMRNEIAALIIAQHVMENVAIQLKHDKKASSGKQRQIITQRLNKTIDGRFGLKIIIDHMLDLYPQYIEYLKEQEKVKQEANAN